MAVPDSLGQPRPARGGVGGRVVLPPAALEGSLREPRSSPTSGRKHFLKLSGRWELEAESSRSKPACRCRGVLQHLTETSRVGRSRPHGSVWRSADRVRGAQAVPGDAAQVAARRARLGSPPVNPMTQESGS